MPLELVSAVTVPDPLKAAVAPVDGAVKVTVAPLTGFPVLPITVTCRDVANAVVTAVLCGVPSLATTLVDPPMSAAALRVTLPLPEFMVQDTVSVWPGEAAT